MRGVIERVVISGYRLFERLEFEPHPETNLLVGANEAGKSTVLEAMALALTGRVNGRWAREELNPYWFHRPSVLSFFAGPSNSSVSPPEISIELYLTNSVDALHALRGVHNSLKLDCPGIALRVEPSSEYSTEFADYMASDPPPVVPVEYYEVHWRDFSDRELIRRPRELATSFIDSLTVRATAGVDHYTRDMLSDNLDGKERAQISLAYRRSRQELTDSALRAVNERLAEENAELHHQPVGLQMDQSARSSWETGVVPQVAEIPFALAGQGQQSMIKVSLAMSRTAQATFVLIEEPENHLSHTSLRRLLARIEGLSGASQQLFVTTHSSFVLNRLGIDKLLLLHDGKPAKLTALDPTTVSYFKRLDGYDTLRLVLAEKVALVEGPSDAMVLERAFKDITNDEPAARGVDIISMGGLTFRRALELCASVGRKAVALRDNDFKVPAELRAKLDEFLAEGTRLLLVSDSAQGKTLEPQLIACNGAETMRTVLGLNADDDVAKWMTDNKTEAAMRITESGTALTYPLYITDAVKFLQ